jgi:hypothetical protein
MHKRLFSLFMVVLLAIRSDAQQFTAEPYQNCDWKLLEIPTGINMIFSYQHAYSFEKSILPVNDIEAIVSVWHSDLQHALMRIDQAGKIKWKSAVPGYILGTVKLKDKIMAVYTKEWDYKRHGDKPLKEIAAIVFDVETGKKMLDKVIFENKSEKFVEPCIHTSSDGQFTQLLVRHTNYEGRKIKEKSSSTEFTVMGLNDRLDVTFRQSLASEALTGEFLGSQVNDKGETFLATYASKRIIVEKFNANHAPAGKLETEADYEQRGILMRLNQKNDQSLLIAMTDWNQHSTEFGLYDFDFAANKTNAFTQSLNKESVKTWKAQNKEQAQRVADFENIHNLKLDCLLQADGKVIVIMDEKYTRFDNSGKVAGTTIGPAVLFFLDNKLKVLNSQAIAKEYDIDNRYLMNFTIGSHVYNGKLLLVTNDGVKFKTSSAIICSIDPVTMKVEAPFYVDKSSRVAEGAATIWFKNNFIITSSWGPCFRVIGF